MQAPSFDVAELRDCLIRIAPELQAVPLYIVLASRLPGNLQSPVFGYTHRDVDLVLREHVDWLGRGVGMVINDVEIQAWDAPAGQDRESYLSSSFIGTGIHEAAHNLPVVPKLEVLNDSREAAAAIAVIKDSVRLEVQDEVTQTKRLMHHAAWFYRVAAHLFFRALDVGVEIEPATIDHGLWLFLNQLEAEAMAMKNTPFTELAEIPFPADFRRAWRGHLLVWVLAHRKDRYDSDHQFLDNLEELTTKFGATASNHPANGRVNGCRVEPHGG